MVCAVMMELLPVALFGDLQQDSTWLKCSRSAAGAASFAAKTLTGVFAAAALIRSRWGRHRQNRMKLHTCQGPAVS